MDSFDWDQNKTPEEAELEEIRETIGEAIHALRESLKNNKDSSKIKAAVADLLKLVQLRKELEGEQPRRVTARWIGECETLND